MLESELSNWCASYVEAFSAYDAKGIEAHWSFPALILQNGRSISLRSAEAFTANTQNLLDFYKRQGVVRAERKLISHMEMGDNSASMTVEDKMLGSDGAQIVSWRASYVLQRAGGAWCAVLAAADGETNAWKMRGTPLGS